MYNFNDSTMGARCLSLIEAFESLLGENFTSFILTITTCRVAILVENNGRFKVFDSHNRDSEGMSIEFKIKCKHQYELNKILSLLLFDPCGTCVLVEIASLDKLVDYFENLYIYVGIIDAVCELRGVLISTNVTGSVGLTTPEISPPVNIENLNRNELI